MTLLQWLHAMQFESDSDVVACEMYELAYKRLSSATHLIKDFMEMAKVNGAKDSAVECAEWLTYHG